MSGSRSAALWLGLRSLLWTLLLPGFFAGFVPWRYFGLREMAFSPAEPTHWLGALGIGIGVTMLVACIWEFARTGRGTLSPADPPLVLVVRGLYRYVRNPMYLSVTALVLSEAVLLQSRPLFLSWLIWFAAANVFVIGYEEPTLRRQFGESYVHYTQSVGRWLPRRQGSRSAN